LFWGKAKQFAKYRQDSYMFDLHSILYAFHQLNFVQIHLDFIINEFILTFTIVAKIQLYEKIIVTSEYLVLESTVMQDCL
jgi:hypothetical protein